MLLTKTPIKNDPKGANMVETSTSVTWFRRSETPWVTTACAGTPVNQRSRTLNWRPYQYNSVMISFHPPYSFYEGEVVHTGYHAVNVLFNAVKLAIVWVHRDWLNGAILKWQLEEVQFLASFVNPVEANAFCNCHYHPSYNQRCFCHFWASL